MESSGEWLERALAELCNNMENSLDLDAEIISGIVSYCKLVPPLDAKEYLDLESYITCSSFIYYVSEYMAVINAIKEALRLEGMVAALSLHQGGNINSQSAWLFTKD